MIVVSFDPGLTGAASVLDHNGLRVVFDLPVMQIPNVGPTAKVKTKIDGRALVKLLRQHCLAGESVKSVIESVNVMGGANNAIQTQGSLLRSLGAIETVLECLGWPPAYAHPQTWKRFFGLIDSDLSDTQRKRKSLECARRLYPQCNEIARAKDHNRAESILIGHWLMRELA
jgi:hypothetical protein